MNRKHDTTLEEAKRTQSPRMRRMPSRIDLDAVHSAIILVTLAYASGVRPTELLSLRAEVIDFANRRIHIRRDSGELSSGEGESGNQGE
jgi:integrase